tara:strand:- start:991 stop:1344 length:354 start_codon:yes stop_codon:yes gene_type:complete
MIHKLSFDDLNTVARNGDKDALRIIKFYSSRCHMCHALKDTYVELSEQFPDVMFYVFNIDIFDGDPEVFPMIDGVPTLCKIDSYHGFVRFPDPNPPDPDMWYTPQSIKEFIQKEKNL